MQRKNIEDILDYKIGKNITIIKFKYLKLNFWGRLYSSDKEKEYILVTRSGLRIHFYPSLVEKIT